MQAPGELGTGAGTTLIKTVNETGSLGSRCLTQKKKPIGLQPEWRLAIGCQTEVEGEV
jgi:hypothetical protein